MDTVGKVFVRFCATAIALAIAAPCFAIVIRHDRDETRYRELGEAHPATARIHPDGTGVLIGAEWVLTAAHVARGVARRSPSVEIAGRSYAVDSVFLHPDWKRGAHDIALFRLKQAVPGVTPVALFRGDDEVGRMVTFVGNGDFGTGETGPTKQDGVRRGATNLVDSADDDWLFFDFDAGDVGTDLEGVSGPGDSGGPALIEQEGTIYTVGVSVWADGDQGPGRYGVREAYTRVSTHTDFVEAVLAGKLEPMVVGSASPPPARPAAGQGVEVALSMSGELPEGPLGQAVQAYLDVYNSNDDARMLAFIAERFDAELREKRTEAEHLSLYRRLRDEMFGGLTFVGVRESSRTSITALFECEKGDMAEIRFEIVPGEVARIAGLQIARVKLG